MTRKIVQFVVFQATWLACVLGAAKGLPWLGPLAALAMGIVFVHAAPRRDRALGLLGVALVLGLLVDSLLTVSGRLVFPELTAGPWPPLAPPWILGLWIALTTTLGSTFGWLAGRPLLAAALGAVSGPLAYLAGERLGAVELGEPVLVSIGLLALAWAACLPLLLKVQVALCPSETSRA